MYFCFTVKTSTVTEQVNVGTTLNTSILQCAQIFFFYSWIKDFGELSLASCHCIFIHIQLNILNARVKGSIMHKCKKG